MTLGIIGKKLGMSQLFREDGTAPAVTAIEAGPCTVVQVKTAANEGYNAAQLGFGEAKRLKSPQRGHLKGLGQFRYLREFRVDDTETVMIGGRVDVSLFQEGDLVDVTGVSKSKGFAGVVKRHHFAGGPKTHGQSDRQRHPGSEDGIRDSVASRGLGDVYKRQVSGSTRKLFRQKGTGYARAGSIRSPLRRGGGIIFGPKPRSYRQAVPKKMRRLALRCVLSAKVSDQELKVLEQLKLDRPRTKDMVSILAALGVDSSALIVTSEVEENVVKSARNLPGVMTLPASLLNVVDILSHKMLLITVAAVRQAEELWGEKLSGEEKDASLPGIAASVNN